MVSHVSVACEPGDSRCTVEDLAGIGEPGEEWFDLGPSSECDTLIQTVLLCQLAREEVPLESLAEGVEHEDWLESVSPEVEEDSG